MGDIFEELIGEQRSLSEELFARSDDLKLFISSKMRGGVFAIEREGCAEALEATGMARAWYWERDADAGPYSDLHVCLGHAATADGLILLLGDELTDTTRQEYEVAHARRVATFIFVDQRETQNTDALAFIKEQRRHSVTKNFANVSELRTHIVDAMFRFAVQSWRRQSYANWERRPRSSQSASTGRSGAAQRRSAS